MKGIQAKRLHIKIGDLWESPLLHILLTEEDDVIVARCLDFTISQHGHDTNDALTSLAEAVKEYILTAIENNTLNTLIDPAHGKYWRMFNELELNQSIDDVQQSFKHVELSFAYDNMLQSIPEISHA